jgi:hypothetical protein
VSNPEDYFVEEQLDLQLEPRCNRTRESFQLVEGQRITVLLQCVSSRGHTGGHHYENRPMKGSTESWQKKK